MVVVYTNEGCGPCRQTKKTLDNLGVAYEEKSIMDEQNLEAVRSLGYARVPVVVAGDTSWDGFRMAELKKLA